MRADTTKPLAELLAPDYHATANIIARARAASPHASPMDISAATHIRIAFVRAAFRLDEDGEPAAVLVGGQRGHRLGLTYPVGTKPTAWSERSEQQLKELKRAKAKHAKWMKERGLTVVDNVNNV